MLKKLALSLVLISSLNAVVSPLTFAMDSVGQMSRDSQKYSDQVIKVASNNWVKNCRNSYKCSLTITITIRVDSDGNPTSTILMSSRNLNFDRAVLDSCREIKLKKPPAGWNPEQPVDVVMHWFADGKARNMPGYPSMTKYRQGVTEYLNENNDKAGDYFTEAIKLDPYLAAAHALLGAVRCRQMRYESGIAEFKETIRLDPEDDDARVNLAKIYWRTHDFKAARKIAEHISPSSRFYPLAQDLLAGRGEFAPNAKADSKPTQVASKPSATHTQNQVPAQAPATTPRPTPTPTPAPVDVNALYQKGIDQSIAGNHEEAIKYYRQVLAHHPNYQPAYTYLGSAYISLKKIPDAIKALQESLMLNRNDDDANYMLGASYLRVNRKAEGLALLNRVKVSSRTYDEAQKLIATSISANTTEVVQRPNQTTVETVVSKAKDTPVKDKWALVIGISKFANPQYNLKYAAKDAQDFYNYLITEGNFKKDHVLLLLNENATRRNIMAAFGDKFLPAVCVDGDLVTIYISTHGTPASKDRGKRNYIIAYDTEAESLYETGVDMDELYKRVKEGVLTNRALIVMDTCYSGAGVPGARGFDEVGNFDAKALAQGSGHLVMTSSSPSQRSWESKVTPNGVFTKYLIQNLKLTKGHVQNSFEKLKSDVGWEVQNAFNQKQNPQIGGEWEGKDLILNAIPTEPREIFNPDLTRMINLQNANPTAPLVVPK
ncbi:caspase family protein [bacterium]|nr:caspase family protein [bacterium]